MVKTIEIQCNSKRTIEIQSDPSCFSKELVENNKETKERENQEPVTIDLTIIDQEIEIDTCIATSASIEIQTDACAVTSASIEIQTDASTIPCATIETQTEYQQPKQASIEIQTDEKKVTNTSTQTSEPELIEVGISIGIQCNLQTKESEIECVQCEQKMSLQRYQDHIEDCKCNVIQCPICLKRYNQRSKVIECGHYMCRSCHDLVAEKKFYKKIKCPVCKTLCLPSKTLDI